MKMIYKKIYAFLLTIFLTFTLFAPKAHALLGVQDLNVESVPQILKYIGEHIGTAIAQRMIDDMVRSTIEWAQSGFEGNPAYVTNTRQFFTDIADQEVGRFINGTDLNYLCSPFQTQIKLALQQSYLGNPNRYQCSLTGIIGNLDAFYNDFSQGGWDGWFMMTQNPSNNPYGAFLTAKIDLDNRIATQLGLQKDELDRNQGFLSFKTCPSEYVVTQADADNWNNSPGTFPKPDGTQWKAGDCMDQTKYTTRTPGSVIQAQLNNALPSGLNKLISAKSIDDLISAFTNGLLNRYVFGPKGLFASGNNDADLNYTSRIATIDLDNDRVPDGRDFDYDGLLNSTTDICFHGGLPPNCAGSASTPNSPYFTPVCQATVKAILSLEDWIDFMITNADDVKSNGVDFKGGQDMAQVWGVRASETQSIVENLLNTITNYRISYLDTMEKTVGKYSSFMARVSGSLLGDGSDLDLAVRGTGGGKYGPILRKSQNQLAYLQTIRQSFGQCTSPNLTGVPNVPPPPDDEEDSCDIPDSNQYAGVLRDAMNAVLAANPDVAALPNIEEGGRQNARTFLALVVTQLISNGYNATDQVLNGNNNPNSGDLIAVWRNGDTEMERYDAISGSAATIGQAAQTNFVGFVPLDCTASGGGNDCSGCIEGTGGGTDPGGGGTPPPPGSGTPFISSVSPTSVAKGTLLTISGTSLTAQVQFFDINGNRYTNLGNVNSSLTTTTIVVPEEVPVGTTRVRIYKDANTVSNEVTIQITQGLATTPPTSSWTPPQTINGWWPELSPDGRYVTYGNWGESWVTDTVTKETWNFSTPSSLPEASVCIAGHWLSNTVMTFVCESNATDTRHYRYEVTVGEWVPKLTGDDPAIVAGNWFKAADGHWASILASQQRLSRDNQVLATGVGRGLSVNGNNTVYICDSTERTICMRTGSTLSKTYNAQIPIYDTTITSGYILYGGYGPVRGITPLGSDINLRLSTTMNEWIGQVVFVGSTPWVVTRGERVSGGASYIFLRPWGSTSAIAVSANVTSLSVRVVGSDFLIAYNSDVGGLSVITIPINSPRTTIN